MPRGIYKRKERLDRRCSYCKVVKLLTDFGKSKSRPLGRDYRCKDCALAFNQGNKEYFKKYTRENPVKMIVKVKKWEDNNKEKKSAHIALQQAVKKGILKRGPCRDCGETKTDGHHPDYKKQLEVIWLCRQHHKDLHKLHKLN